MANVLGGFTDPSPANEGIQQIADQVKTQVKEKTGQCFVEYRAVLYSSQVVSGTNYLIKVHVGGEEYIHLLVFKSFDGCKVVLRGVQQHKCKDDPVVPFPDDQTTC